MTTAARINTETVSQIEKAQGMRFVSRRGFRAQPSMRSDAYVMKHDEAL